MRGLQRLVMRCGVMLAAIALTGGLPALAQSPATEPHLAVVTPVFSQLVVFSLPRRGLEINGFPAARSV